MTIVGYLKKAVIFVVGLAVIIVGIILLPLPGPGFVVIGVGLFILSTEFEWADRYLIKLKDKIGRAYERVKSGPDEKR